MWLNENSHIFQTRKVREACKDRNLCLIPKKRTGPLLKRPRRRRKKEKKTLVFEIKLSENANSQYEYNYKNMVRSSEHTLKTL